MKVVITILLSISLALCEVPPPYPPRGFRPSPPFNLPSRQPQTSYGVPQPEPSKFSQQSPQIQYNVPNQQEPSSSPNLTPNFNSKQTIPSTSYGVPVTSSPYRTIIDESQIGNGVQNQQRIQPDFNSRQTGPSTSYGGPATSTPYRTIISESQADNSALNQQEIRPTPNFNRQTIPSTSYGAPASNSPIRTEPQVAYGTPNRQNQYDDARNVETLEQIKQLNLLLQLSQSSNANQQKQIDINLSQSQNSNRNVGIPTQQYLPVKEATNFRGNLQPQTSQQNIGRPTQGYLPVQQPTNLGNGFDSNNQESFDVRIPNPNLQKLSQQYLPVKDASNFNKGVQFPQAIVPQRQKVQPNINYEQPLNNPQLVNTAGSSQNSQQRPSNINPNIALTPQNPNPNLNSYGAPLQSNVDVQQLNVRRLQNSNVQTAIRQNTAQPVRPVQQNRVFEDSNIQRVNTNNVQTAIRQNTVQPLQPVQQNRVFGDSNIQGVNREQVDETYLPPTTTARTIIQPNSGSASLPKDNSGEDEQSTESKEEAGGPNIAVATAVSGVPGGQSFYLLQPDGRLQRVVYQKMQGESDRENEYTANYLFENIQAVPNLAYGPLVAVGKR